MGELMNQHTLHVDQFIALNDEIAALVRAGVPLPHGLRELGRDVPGRLGAAAEALGHSLESGTNLLDALADDRTAFPPRIERSSPPVCERAGCRRLWKGSRPPRGERRKRGG